MRNLKELKMQSEYSSCDPTKLDDWLKGVSHDLGQYTYQLLASGVDRPFLPQVSEENLREDCGVTNGVHRAKMLQTIRGRYIWCGRKVVYRAKTIQTVRGRYIRCGRKVVHSPRYFRPLEVGSSGMAGKSGDRLW